MLNFLEKMGEKLSCFLGKEKKKHFKSSNTKELKKIFSMTNLASFFPYDQFDEETGLFINQNSIGFAIHLHPLVGCDESIQREITNIFEEHLEVSHSIQCLLWADPRTNDFTDFWQAPRKAIGGILETMGEKRVSFFKEAAYLYPRLFRFVLSYTAPKEGDIQNQLQELNLKKEKCLKILRNVTSTATCLEPNDLLKIIDGFLNCEAEAITPSWNCHQALASQIVGDTRVQIEKDQLFFEKSQKAFKSYRVVNFPDHWSLASMQQLIGDTSKENYRLKVPFYIHYGVHCPKKSKVENKFKVRDQMVQKQGQSSLLRSIIPELGRELKESQEVKKSLHEGSHLVETYLSVGLWASPSKLVQEEETLKSLFRFNHFQLVSNDCTHLPQFLMALPLSWSEHIQDIKYLKLLKTTLVSACANLVPMQGEWYGTSKTPGMLLLGRCGQLANWSPFDGSGNYNISILGKSGGGKSVFMQELVYSGLGSGAKVFIIDIGRSFDKLCQLFKGQQIHFSNKSSICLNPFSHISLIDQEKQENSLSCIKSIISCMADATHGLKGVQNGYIEQAILEVWHNKGNQSTISDVVSCLKKSEEKEARDVAVMLTSYTKEGTLGRYFNGENNVDFSNPLVLIELEELKEKKELQAVVLQLFIMAITDQAFLGDRKTRYYICIDEAWDLLRAPQTADFIATLAKRLRKYNGALVTATQNIEDFLTSPGGKAAFSNSDWTVILEQKDGSSVESIGEAMKMNDKQKRDLSTVKTAPGYYSEFMIKGGGGYSILRLALDPFSNLLYTTKAEEYTKVNTLIAQGKTPAEAIEYLLEKTNKS
jgi:conjugal transfer ATP-binding protein TraC